MTKHHPQNTDQCVNIGRRLMAHCCDRLILNLIPLSGLLYMALSPHAVDFFSRIISLIALVMLPSVIFSFVYYSWFIAEHGATPGKKIWGVEITDEEGQHLSFTLAFFREFVAKQVSNFFLGLGYIWIMIDQRHQAWHDVLLGSIAKKKDVSLWLSWLLTVGLFSLNIALGVIIFSRLPYIIALFA